MYIPKTQTERTAATVEFFLAHKKVPVILSVDAARNEAKGLIAAFDKPDPKSSFYSIVEITLSALRELYDILQHTLKVDETKSKSKTATERNTVSQRRHQLEGW